MKEFEQIYEESFKSVYRYIYALSGNHALAEDITQDTFLKAYEYLVINGVSFNNSWLYTVARNKYISNIRKGKFLHKNTKELETDEILDAVIDLTDTPEEYVLKKEKSKKVIDTLMKLNESYKTALILREYNELSIDEISDIIGVKRTYGKQLMYKAREKFKKEYGGYYNE